jgi:hypothetical protein
MNALHWLAGLIVLAEALNKLERARPFRSGLSPRLRLVELLKTLGWMALATGSGAAVLLPLLGPGTYLQWLRPLTDTSVLIGFALLIIRTRVREGLMPYARRQEDKAP